MRLFASQILLADGEAEGTEPGNAHQIESDSEGECERFVCEKDNAVRTPRHGFNSTVWKLRKKTKRKEGSEAGRENCREQVRTPLLFAAAYDVTSGGKGLAFHANCMVSVEASAVLSFHGISIASPDSNRSDNTTSYQPQCFSVDDCIPNEKSQHAKHRRQKGPCDDFSAQGVFRRGLTHSLAKSFCPVHSFRLPTGQLKST